MHLPWTGSNGEVSDTVLSSVFVLVFVFISGNGQQTAQQSVSFISSLLESAMIHQSRKLNKSILPTIF